MSGFEVWIWRGSPCVVCFEEGNPRVYPFGGLYDLARHIIDSGYYEAEGFRLQYCADEDEPSDNHAYMVRGEDGKPVVKNVGVAGGGGLVRLASELANLGIEF